MTGKFQQRQELVISDLKTLKVMSNPLRTRILELALDTPLTVKQIAKAVDLPHSRLYYHVKLLEKHGLLCVVDTRLVSGIVEKIYQTVAQYFTVDKELFSSGTRETLDEIVYNFFDSAKADARRSLKAGLLKVAQSADGGPELSKALLSRTQARLSPEKAEAFKRRLNEIMEEFYQYDDPDNPDAEHYNLILGMYPILRHPSASQEKANDETKVVAPC